MSKSPNTLPKLFSNNNLLNQQVESLKYENVVNLNIKYDQILEKHEIFS